MKHNFEERKANRINGYETRADRARNEAENAFKRSNNAVAGIPFGQPILVGHHSERAHRNAIEKSHNAMRKGIELEGKAKHYENRAKSAEHNNAIFSDDPNASEKLAEKIERLERRQELMRSANKCVRKNDVEGLLNLGFSETSITKLFKPDFCGRVGFPDYALTNNSANIRRLKQRLAEQQKLDAMETTETAIGDVQIIDNAKANRTQIIFPGKPSEAFRAKLKSNGFRWSPSEGAWQRHLSGHARFLAERLAKEYAEVK
jgi:hypothetical protein